MGNCLLIAALVFMDSLFGCLQVRNLITGRRLPILLASLALSTCKICSILLVVKAANIPEIATYVIAGSLGAQVSVSFRNRG